MARHMKTSVHIPDALFEKAQELARREQTTLEALIQEGLQRVLDQRKDRPSFSLKDGSSGGEGLQSDYARAGWKKIRAAVYGEPEE